MKATATTIVVVAALGAAGTAIAADCPPKDGSASQDPTSTTQTTSSSSTQELEGTVTSVDRKGKKFRLREDDGDRVTIKVNGNTDYGDGVSSLRGLKRGTEDVAVTARKTKRGLVATDVGCPAESTDEESAAQPAA